MIEQARTNVLSNTNNMMDVNWVRVEAYLYTSNDYPLYAAGVNVYYLYYQRETRAIPASQVRRAQRETRAIPVMQVRRAPREIPASQARRAQRETRVIPAS